MHLSNDLVRIVKISPFDTANWPMCQRMFSGLGNHICPLISPEQTPPSDVVLLNPVYNSIVVNPQRVLKPRRKNESKCSERGENKRLRGIRDEGKSEAVSARQSHTDIQ